VYDFTGTMCYRLKQQNFKITEWHLPWICCHGIKHWVTPQNKLQNLVINWVLHNYWYSRFYHQSNNNLSIIVLRPAWYTCQFQYSDLINTPIDEEVIEGKSCLVIGHSLSFYMKSKKASTAGDITHFVDSTKWVCKSNSAWVSSS